MIDFSENANSRCANIEEVAEKYDVQEPLDQSVLEETYGLMVMGYMNAQRENPEINKHVSFPEPSQAYMVQLSAVLPEAGAKALSDKDTYTEEQVALSELTSQLPESLQAKLATLTTDQEEIADIFAEAGKTFLADEGNRAEYISSLADKIYLDNVSTGNYSSLTFNGVDFPNGWEFTHEIAITAMEAIPQAVLEKEIDKRLSLTIELESSLAEKQEQDNTKTLKI